MKGICDKFVLLLWKNFLLQYKSPCMTAVEIIIPLLVSIIFVVIRCYTIPKTHDGRRFASFCPAKFPFLCDDVPTSSFEGFIKPAGVPDQQIPFQQFDLAYSPTGNAAIDNSMALFKFLFKDVKSFANEEVLEEHFLTSGLDSTLAAIVFDDGLKDGAATKLPDDTEVKIRFPGELREKDKSLGTKNWETNLLYPILQTPGPRNPKDDFGAPPSYHEQGFLALQSLLTYFLIYGQGGVTKLEDIKTIKTAEGHPPPTVKMQRFSHGEWITDALQEMLLQMMAVLFLMGFYYPCVKTATSITVEKEKQLKETMKMMGVPNWLHWTAWFVKTLVFLMIPVILIVVLWKVAWCSSSNYSVLTYADPGVLFLFLFLYTCSLITFCFAISVFFSKASTASTVAGIVFFVTYLPYMVTKNQYSTMSLTSKMLMSLGINTAMSYGLQLMLMFEGTREGIQWNNIFRRSTPDDNLTMAHVMLMLIIDMLIYLLIALYVEAVFPGEYGVPQPWYYLFTKTYWIRPKNDAVPTAPRPSLKNGNDNFEKEPRLEVGIQIKNLRKVFGKQPAVRNLTLNIYKDQITVLLGHNGAGKTTTMSMLTGMFPPTSGTAIVNGHDIITDIDGARSSLGLCPQHNILFDELTVKEHLMFFAKLKGLKGKDLKQEVDDYIKLLGLEQKKKVKSSKLSGGMKRKVCVAMAMCGNSKVVILDEPTAGMDPSARRAIWDLIQQQKKGRTILLTTHFMDEADLLGDRIAIMAGGELQCCGTSFFLKKRYATGYRLIIDKAPQCIPEKVTKRLRKYISSIQMSSNIGSELTYSVGEDHASALPSMLGDLEENSAKLGIRSYGISLSSLEEVFMKVGGDHGQEEAYNKAQEPHTSRRASTAPPSAYGSNESVEDRTESKATTDNPKVTMDNTKVTMDNQCQFSTGCKLIHNQFQAMFMKKFISMKRSWILVVIQILVPAVFVIIALIQAGGQKASGDLPKLPLSLESYEDPVTLIEKTAGKTTAIYNVYTETLTSSKQEIVDDIHNATIKYTEEIPSIVRRSYIVGAAFKATEGDGTGTITALFNNDPLHSPPLALAVALSSIYKLMTNKGIRFVHHPMPFTAETKVKHLMQSESIGFSLGLNLALGLAFVSPLFLIFYIRERVSKSKHLQLVSGVKVCVFWIAAFLCDFAVIIVMAVVIIIVMACFQRNGYKTAFDLALVLLILVYFGVAVLPLLYLASFMFKLPSSGLTKMVGLFMMTGAIGFVIVTLLTQFNLNDVVGYLHWVLLIDPHFSVATGIRNSYMTYSTNQMCLDFVDACVDQSGFSKDQCWDLACSNEDLQGFCCTKEPDYFKWEFPGLEKNLCYSFGLGLAMFLLLIMIDSKWFAWLENFHITRKPSAGVPNEDSDVAEEKRMIKETDKKQLLRDNMIVLSGVTKYYKSFRAVNGISIAIKNYECFGLLGLNGAGKTTTFKIMTGDVKMTHGKAWLNGYNINSSLGKVRKSVGYCPQFDALLDDLTVKETLMMFALIRGVPKDERKDLVEKLARDFDFQRYSNRTIKKLSGGNKRKVSAAVATIGDPSVICLDEPTTGMDPATKRYLWNALCQIRDRGKCIVLTSHSMEECEALCTRLVIMVQGNFRCLGSVQHLKNKFAAGCTLTIKIKKLMDTERVENFIKKKFHTVILREKHEELLTYQIMDTSMSWSKMFGILEGSRKELHIEDYSLGQSSLEQVFLSFQAQK